MKKFFKRKFPAVFDFNNDNGEIVITFPDIPGCLSHAFFLQEAIQMATDALELMLDGVSVKKIPTASTNIKPKSDLQKIQYIEATLEVIDGKLYSPNCIEGKEFDYELD